MITTLTLQDMRENRYRLNLGEAGKRYWLHYQSDPSDLNTLDNIDFSQTEYSTEPISVQNPEFLNIKGLVDRSIPFSLGIRKGAFTAVEEAALPFAELADEVVQFFGGSGNLVAKIKGRIGVLQISQQYFTITKLMYTVSGKQPSNYLNIIGADPIYKVYHTINQVRENMKRLRDSPIPFSEFDFESIVNNNYVEDQNGDSLEILTFVWTSANEIADIEYARPSFEGFNTKTIKING